MNYMLMLALTVSAAAAPTPESPGQAIFAKKCAACHGKDAKGSVSMARMFKVDPKLLDLTSEDAQKKADTDLTKTISAGRNKMPAFKGKLKEAEIADVVAYVRTFAPKAGEGAK